MTLWTTGKMTIASTTLTVDETVMASVFGTDKSEADKNVDANIFFFFKNLFRLQLLIYTLYTLINLDCN